MRQHVAHRLKSLLKDDKRARERPGTDQVHLPVLAIMPPAVDTTAVLAKMDVLMREAGIQQAGVVITAFRGISPILGPAATILGPFGELFDIVLHLFCIDRNGEQRLTISACTR